jgi:DNA-binding Lrp family transcriptional regulator
MKERGFFQFNEADLNDEKLNEKTKKLLYFLSDNARLSNNELGRLIRLSSEGVRKKVSNLEEKEVIWPTSLINYKKLGYSVYGIFLQVKEVDPEQKKKFYDFLKSDFRVLEVAEFTDKIDFCIKLLLKDMDEASFFVDKIADILYDQITELEIYDIKDMIVNRSVPWVYTEKEHFKKIEEKKKNEDNTHELSKIDEGILNELIADSRVKITKMKQNLNTDMSIGNLIYRKKHIENSGIIDSFSAKVDLSKFSIHGYYVLMSLNLATQEGKNKFKAFLAEKPYILEAFHAIGKWNYVAVVATRNLRVLQEFINKTRKHYHEKLSNIDVLIMYHRLMFPSPVKIVKNE